MFIHNEDNTEVELKITDEGELFAYCPKCKRVWEIPLKAIKEPRENREFIYDGAKLNLDLVKPDKPQSPKNPSDIATLSRIVFPEAYE